MKKFGILIISILLLSGCSTQINPKVDEQKKQFIVDNINNQNYKVIAPMKESEIKGITNDYATQSLSLDEFETGLQAITKKYVDTNNHYYQPGNILTRYDAMGLLDRELNSDQMKDMDDTFINNGINPILKKGDNPKNSIIYANTLIEQDYYTFDKKKNKMIDTSAIGIGINPKYTYVYKGEKHTINITDEQLMSYVNGRLVNKITSFIHQIDGCENVNIVYGFFKQSSNDVIPGVYYASGYVKGTENKISNVKELDNKYVVYPSDDANDVDKDLNKVIKELSKQIYEYFPTVSGTSAIGFYQENKLERLTINVSTNMYSQVEIESFCNFIEQRLKTNINLPYDVVVSRSNGDALAIISSNGNKIEKYIY